MEGFRLKRSKKFRIAVVGYPGTGKKSLILSYIKKSPVITISSNEQKKRKFYFTTNFLRRNVKLKIVHTKGGKETYRNCSKSDAVIVCYSVSDRESYEKLKKDIEDVVTGVPILLVGTKTDERQSGVSITELVHHSEGFQLKDDLGAVGFVECSSKSFLNIDKVFEQAIKTAHSTKSVQFSIQLTIVGDSCIGKSYLINKIISHYMHSQHRIIENSSIYSIVMPNRKVYIVSFVEVSRIDSNDTNFWRRQSFMADAFLLMYSIHSRETFYNAQHKWLPKIKEMNPKTPIILIANANPALKDRDIVTSAEGKELQKKINADDFVEYSPSYEVNKIVEKSTYAIEHNTRFRTHLCILQ